VHPIPRGFGYAVVEEDPVRLVDWGVASCRKRKNPHCLFVLGRMLDRFDPTVLVIENPHEARTLRREVLGRFVDDVTDLLAPTRIAFRAYSRREIREAFAAPGAVTKQEIAELLGRQFPELAARIPPVREIWHTEDARMSIFDALSLALTHLSTGRAMLSRDS